MQIRISDRRNTNFSVKPAGVSATAFYDTGPNMIFMSYMCYATLKDPPPLQNV